MGTIIFLAMVLAGSVVPCYRNAQLEIIRLPSMMEKAQPLSDQF